MSYSVDLWGSHPSLGNDDCFTGDSAPTLEAAREILASLTGSKHFRNLWAYACIKDAEGTVVHEQKRDREPSVDDDSADRSEFAMQQGMAHGIGAYNEALGYDTDEPAPGFRR